MQSSWKIWSCLVWVVLVWAVNLGLNTGYSRQLATEHPERNEDNLKNKDDLKK